MNRGEIWRYRPQASRRHEQSGARFALIVSADEFLGLSTVMVAPTSQSAREAVFRPEVVIAGRTTRVMIEQLRVTDVDRLGERVGRVEAHEQEAIDQAIALVLGLS